MPEYINTSAYQAILPLEGGGEGDGTENTPCHVFMTSGRNTARSLSLNVFVLFVFFLGGGGLFETPSRLEEKRTKRRQSKSSGAQTAGRQTSLLATDIRRFVCGGSRRGRAGESVQAGSSFITAQVTGRERGRGMEEGRDRRGRGEWEKRRAGATQMCVFPPVSPTL